MAETALTVSRDAVSRAAVSRGALPSRSLPRRDAESLAVLNGAAQLTRPVVLARERVLPVPGTLGGLLPGAALQRGAVVAVHGEPGTGATSVALAFAAAATAVGEWAGAVGLEPPSGRRGAGDLGAGAALEAGVALERFAMVRRVPPARWATAVAALLDGVSLVLAEVPRYARAGETRRLVARARERGAVLVPLCGPGVEWPADAALRLRAEGGPWPGLTAGAGLLAERDVRVHVEGRGVAGRGGAHPTREETASIEEAVEVTPALALARAV
jgi:hypothetical protein